MINKKMIVIGSVLFLLGALALGVLCSTGNLSGWRPNTTQDQPGDCDAGDLRESKPDPDCHGLWLGTPTPGAKKPSAAPKTPAAKPKATRR
jgi:hypothetical protein